MAGESLKNGKRRGGKRSSLWIWGAVIVVLVAVILFALRPSPVEVDVARVERGPLQVTLDEEGETRARQRYVISAPVSGQVLRIDIEPGDPVVAGETALVQFQPAPPTLLDARTRAEAAAGVEAAQSDVGLARARRDQARAERDYADSEYRRVTQLKASGIVSDEQIDAAELRLNTGNEALSAAEFAVATAEHALEQARARLNQDFGGGRGAASGGAAGATKPITIRSPVGGVVLRRLRQSAAVVQAGEPLLEVADPALLEIVSDFLSEDAVRIQPGADVRIERWGGDQPLRGRVRRVEPSGFTKISALGVEEQRVNVIIDLVGPRDTWAALGDGFRVETRVVLWEQPDVLQVPTGALFRHEAGWAVFSDDGGTARLTPVEIGWRSGTQAQLLSGLSEGAGIVLHPSDAIHDGASIAERED